MQPFEIRWRVSECLQPGNLQVFRQQPFVEFTFMCSGQSICFWPIGLAALSWCCLATSGLSEQASVFGIDLE